ncbi:hypothetical protein SLEP1_g53713 [Rubroshorea leprosula]|uniref:Secreted protein n=1 Tax=Rubroshorea leprosula TaxID=152421 RepID=A0AAV5MB61_9ROSI|nr:hypothetical protein SLEP1_g53713 [Rubroshorea leprosula]
MSFWARGFLILILQLQFQITRLVVLDPRVLDTPRQWCRPAAAAPSLVAQTLQARSWISEGDSQAKGSNFIFQFL